MEIPLTGNVKDIALVKILMSLNRSRKTGTLSLTTRSFTKKIYFSGGDVVFASSTFEDDRLGEMLLKAGKITVEQYDKSVEVLKASKGKRQGAILVELGYLVPKDLFWGVKYQVREIVQSMFLVEEGDYAFHEGEFPTQEVITLKNSVGNLIYSGVNKIVNLTRIRSEMPHTDSVLKLSADPLSLFQDIELSQQDKKILSLVDGKKSIKQIVDSSWMGSFEAMKVLYVLWAIGMLEEVAQGKKGADQRKEQHMDEDVISLDDILKPYTAEEEIFRRKIEETFAHLGSLNMMELLEVDERADSEALKKSYYRLTKEFHPDRYFSSDDYSLKMKLTEIFDALTRAYDTLKDDQKRIAYLASLRSGKQAEEGDSETRAAEEHRDGVREFRKGNYQAAIERFKRAAQLAPKHAGYLSYLSLAYSKVPEHTKEAEEALLAALKIEPFNAEFHSHLGLVYMKAGLKKKAHLSFQKALKIDPGNEKAKRGLEQTR